MALLVAAEPGEDGDDRRVASAAERLGQEAGGQGLGGAPLERGGDGELGEGAPGGLRERRPLALVPFVIPGLDR